MRCASGANLDEGDQPSQARMVGDENFVRAVRARGSVEADVTKRNTPLREQLD
jgi:hypothetical protein